MLNKNELEQLFDKLGTPIKGRRLVEKARKDAPVRKVQSTGGNIITECVSFKMGRTILTESRTVEYLAQIQYEYDDDVIEYYAQPCEMELVRTDGGNKKKSRITLVPDFLVIRHNMLLIEEWKTENRLLKLAAKYPGRYVREIDGWHDPEVESYYNDLGITYRLRSGAEHPQQFVMNLEFLSDYFDQSCPPVEKEKIQLIQEVLSKKAYLTIAELFSITNEYIKERLSEVQTEYLSPKAIVYDDIYKAIVDKKVAFDFYKEDASSTHTALVYRDSITLLLDQTIEQMPQAARLESLHFSLYVGASIEYEGEVYRILLLGKEKIIITSESESTLELKIEVVETLYQQGKINIINTQGTDCDRETIETASPKRIAIGLKRQAEIELAAVGLFPKNKRTLQRYKEIQRNAGSAAIDQVLSLAPVKDGRGKARNLSEIHLKDIKQLVLSAYNNPTNKKKATLYKIDYKNLCTQKGYEPCSIKTFYKELNGLVKVRQREGKRVAYQQSQIVWYLHHDEAIHGVRPFQIVHIDHTLADLQLCGFVRKINLGKAWVSIGMDASSRKVLGLYTSYAAPSALSDMMVLRDIVRKHGRMPYMIVVDNGSDYHSKNFARVNELYNCKIRYRPAGEPRHGSVIERFFGTADQKFIHNLVGNTQVMKNVRMVTKSIRPEQFAEWTLPAFHAGLEYFCDNLYGEEGHLAHRQTPNENFKIRMIETGERRNRLVRYDRQFLIETCLTPPSLSTRKVDWVRGVKVDHIWYSAKEFRTEYMGQKRVEVRIDPWDASVVYALVNDKWVQCRSKLFVYRNKFTKAELKYGLDEMAKKFRVKKEDYTPEKVAEWIKLMNPSNFDPRLIEQWAEQRIIYEPLKMTAVDPNSSPALISETFLDHPSDDDVEILDTKKITKSKPKKKDNANVWI